ncbi:Acg family FMN-binding oxidoreductase [Modestobacter marinus]|uniref:Acg family FMN-binding oxidoreductase n=1 Tax=Modestobacter marinus TaxID=477641 RepID=UPI001C967558|nr:nitroreductase family protein [Modestobacter marinus]
MTTPTTGGSPTGEAPDPSLDERMRALEAAADAARAAPSVHDSRPWTIVLHRDRLELLADPSRRLAALDPAGRELVESLGAALFNVRVSLAAGGWAVAVDRFPDSARPDLAAVVRPVHGAPEPGIAQLASVVHQRRSNRRGFLAEEVPDELLDHLAAAAAAEGATLVPVLTPEHRRLVVQLSREADMAQSGDPACRADLRRWRTQPAPAGGPSAPEDPFPPERARADSESGADRSFVLLATRADDPPAWLRAGEALQRLLLQLTRLGWAAGPMTQALEVSRTRDQLRAGITGEQHPQMLLRIGFAAPAEEAPRRRRDDAVRDRVPRPVPDGRGGTTWV